MTFTKGSIRIVVIAFLEIISFDRFYASGQGCFTVQNKTICYFEPIVANRPTVTRMTWDEAWNVCAENNSTLPVIDDRMTAETLRKHMGSKSSRPVDMWLAGREIRTDDWRWLNGKQFGRVNSFANPGKFKAVYDTNAVITGDLQYMWIWAKYEKYYICHYNESELCQNKSTIPWKNGCLFVNNDETLNFMDARNRCLDGGGDLATFEEDEGLDMLRNDSSLLSKSKQYWIGLRQNWWIWNETATSKDIKYSNWLNYENRLNKHCLYIRLIDYKWDQDQCTSKKTFLCQIVNTTASTQGIDTESTSPTGSPDVHTGDTLISKDLLLIIVGSVIAVAIVVVIIVVLIVVLKIPRNRAVNRRRSTDKNPTVRREMSAHRNENKSVKTKSIADIEISNHYAEIPRADGYDDDDECKDDPQPGIVYAALEFDANKAIYEEPDSRSQRKQEASAPVKAGTMNKNVESPTHAAAGTIYANL